jgi:hypothetical protein
MVVLNTASVEHYRRHEGEVIMGRQYQPQKAEHKRAIAMAIIQLKPVKITFIPEFF